MYLKKNFYIHKVNKNWKKKKEKIQVVGYKYNSNTLSHSQRAFLSYSVYILRFDIPYS